MKSKTIIGIDPGRKSGAIAIIKDMSEVVFFDFIDDNGPAPIIDVKLNSSTLMCYIEGIPANAQVVHAYGHFEYLTGVMAALGVPYKTVWPTQWKRHHKTWGIGKKESKHKALEIARALYPQADLSKKKHHNRAEALLIADYGMKQ